MTREEFKTQYRLARLIYGQHVSVEHHKGPGFDCVRAANTYHRSRVEKYKGRSMLQQHWEKISKNSMYGMFGGNQSNHVTLAKTWKDYGPPGSFTPIDYDGRFLFWEMFFAVVGIILILFYLEVSSR